MSDDTVTPIPNFELSDHLEDCCDHIDAAFFSGDSMHSPNASSRMRMYIERWTLQLSDIEESRIMSEWDVT